MDINNIYIFLESEGLHLINSENSKTFGDYFKIFSDEIFSVRFVKDKSIITIDIQSALENDRFWYDLALIRKLLYNKARLNLPMSTKQYCTFLKNNIDNIKFLFNNDNYSLTRSKLEKLKSDRIKQLFPNIGYMW